MIEKFFDIKPQLTRMDKEVMEQCRPYFERIDEIAQHNQLKVLRAFIDNNISLYVL